ncbi:MAG TPA: tRNA pseudouridine(38-40) synthase TruA [Acidisoma sp.]|jgi:tRNA pseudouridine38-40 synthase|uniref:tRNA pseudouridine(38-40) synthase TruA n=1 Tax=Acidisoma sp. TaxID=1872115 RepID=UPI002BD1E999|nr:tRNA pseudouridine(38-40) synthase TruA [Acidisoma sp.]HTI02147.1 tRNA pseudouridine(38-40) synthase TruA [Acidisoma sp.]
MTTRYALLLEYDGRGFVGWQRQLNGLSIQEVLEAAASNLADGAPVAAAIAGRTDAGVHAEGQVAMIALPKDLPPHRVAQALNFHMKPYPVVVQSACVAPADWHPRFDALRRRYRYVILNRSARPALETGRVWHVPHALEASAMAEGAKHLVGRHDFTSFRAASCQAKSPVRTLDRLDVRRDGMHIIIEAEARSFLHHQVRNMVGTLKLVGDGIWEPIRVARALQAHSRAAAGPTAPPDGLTFISVDYDPPLFPRAG